MNRDIAKPYNTLCKNNVNVSDAFACWVDEDGGTDFDGFAHVILPYLR